MTLTIWDLSSPVLYLLEPTRRRALRQKLARLDQRMPLTATLRVLDVGCGTGTLLAELARYPCQVAGVEPTGALLNVARRRFPGVPLAQEPAHAMRSIQDASQDVSLVSAVLHGLQPEYRQQVYRELRRVTRGLVAVIDYHRNRNPAVALAEWLEGGDYFNFVDVVDRELAAAFPHVEVERFRGFESLYLCWVEPGPGPAVHHDGPRSSTATPSPGA